VASTEKIRTWIEHTLDEEKLESNLNTIIKKKDGSPGYEGLSNDEALMRIQSYGPNVLSEKKTLPWPIKLLLEFTGLFNYMLWIGAILVFIAYIL
jgi:magnesium-transporting ATPase (P-type)